jgi:opacity protein-like surface antigen
MNQNIRSWGMLAAGGMCLMAWPGSGRSQGLYFNTEIGAALADQVKFKEFFGPTGGPKFDLDTGVRFGASCGYNFNRYLGVEGETGFIYNEFQNLDASLAHVPLMINVVVRYDVPRCKLVPYAGIGGGGDLSIITLNNVGGNGVIADGTDTTSAWAWQAFAGVRFKFNKQMSAGLGYKYYSVDSASWDFAGFSDSIKIGQANVHSILFEFNMKF